MNMSARVAWALIALQAVAVASATSAANEEWRFAVSLDGKRIGYHRFSLHQGGAQRELSSEARFNVKFLFVNAYRYAHEDRELWNADCLQTIDARTDDNGAVRTVRGALSDARFMVTAGERTFELPSCVMTFAYWNPRILQASHLLNPQTGEYVPVRIIRVGAEEIVARGVIQHADHYRLCGDGKDPLRIDLWYSQTNEWLALESLTQDGRRLHYRIE